MLGLVCVAKETRHTGASFWRLRVSCLVIESNIWSIVVVFQLLEYK
jgi:hypothetical protein